MSTPTLPQKFNLEYIRSNSEYLFHLLRWGKSKVSLKSGFHCPHCGSTRVSSKDLNHHHCNGCNRTFTDTSGTIFHSTKIPLWKWLTAIYYFIDSPRGISSYTLSKYISVSQPTAWRMQMLLRTHLREQIELSGDVLLDEVYIGAEWKWQPTYKKMRRIQAMETKLREENPRWKSPTTAINIKSFNYRCASEDKMPCFAMRDYNAKKLEIIYLPTIKGDLLLNLVKMRDKGIKRIITDQSKLYGAFPYHHSICNHAKGQYKSKDGYTSNPIENHFTNLRRMWHGTYQWFTKKYCQAYLDEFTFRYNYRHLSTFGKFFAAFSLIISYFCVKCLVVSFVCLTFVENFKRKLCESLLHIIIITIILTNNR